MRLRSNSPSPKSQHKKRREGRKGKEREGKEREGRREGKGEERSNPIYNNESKPHTERERKTHQMQLVQTNVSTRKKKKR